MQPYITQALLATRIDEMRREAAAARSARDAKRARRARRDLVRVRPARGEQPSCRPEHAGLGAA